MSLLYFLFLSKICSFERLEIKTAFASAGSGGWNIVLEGVNTGPSYITLVDIILNRKPASEYQASTATIKVGGVTYEYKDGFSVKLAPNQDLTITIHIDGGFTSGQTVEVGLVSLSGVVFKRTIVLP